MLRFLMRLAMLGGLAFALNSAPLEAQRAPKTAELQPLTTLTWKDVTGKTYAYPTITQKKATVFFFLSTQCPIANIYTPRLIELGRKYAPQGVQCFLVNSNREDTFDIVKKYAKERNFPFPAVKDNGTQLADALMADTTPEAVILDSRAVVRYRGRIDDNKDRSKIIRHDVQEALDALLANKPVPRPRTLAFGCRIFRDTAPTTSKVSLASVTYTQHVAPILAKNCLQCHSPGEAGPFSLNTYAQAKTWAAAIKDYTQRRLMPPWKAVPGYGDFHDAKYLTDAEIATLARWAESGAPLGDSKRLATVQKITPPQRSSDWVLGKPDVILKSVRPYHVPAEGPDVYRHFVLPYEATEETFLQGVEFKPDNRAVVHHVILYLDKSGKSPQLDGKEAEPGYTVPNSGGVSIGIPFDQVVWAAGWAPGNTTWKLPEGYGVRVGKGWKLVLQVHYHPNGKVEADQTAVGLLFAKPGTVEREMITNAVINPYFQLKPGLARQEIKGKLTLPWDVTVWSVAPHMHFLGREMKIIATLPDGSTRPMIYVNDWDFNWQETYRYKQPLKLPKGTRIDMVAIFDNSENNPRQPSHPPRVVSWGEETTNEMCIGFFQMTVDEQNLRVSPASFNLEK